MEWNDLNQIEKLNNAPIRELAETKAEQVRELIHRSPEEKLDLDSVILLGGFMLKSVTHDPPPGWTGDDGHTTANLIPGKNRDGFIILTQITPPRSENLNTVSEEVMQRRLKQHRRFIIAHEVAHSFFTKRVEGKTPQRLWPVNKLSTIYRSEEHFAEEFASELLIPRQTALELNEADHELSERYDVTPTLARLVLSGIPLLRYLKRRDSLTSNYEYIHPDTWWED